MPARGNAPGHATTNGNALKGRLKNVPPLQAAKH